MRYAAFLRGINVGGHNKVPMAELRALLTELGYADLATHLQSGNAVFSSAAPAAELEQQIGDAVAARLGVNCAIMVRTGAELAAAVTGSPLGAEPENPSRYFVAFLSAQPAAAVLGALEGVSFEPDALWVYGREAYLWCPAGAGDTKLTNAALEKRLGVAATARNWTTVTKLATMASG
ncbi:MAG: DUF1697 domain-containing protein [Streptosporangiaceae bacterium]